MGASLTLSQANLFARQVKKQQRRFTKGCLCREKAKDIEFAILDNHALCYYILMIKATARPIGPSGAACL